jgi:predicted nucleic-acid-binding protein
VIGVDTNVLVRYIMQDDRVQSRLATAMLDALTPERPAYVSAVALAETSWVLSSTYGAPRSELAEAIEALLDADALVVEHAASARRALVACRSGADFADAFIAAINQQAGCGESVTFDKDAAKRAGMRLLK